MLIVKAQAVEKVRKFNKEKSLGVDNITTDFFAALDEKVNKVIEEAVLRAKDNNRKTLMGRDV